MDRNLGRQSWKVKVERRPGPFLGVQLTWLDRSRGALGME